MMYFYRTFWRPGYIYIYIIKEMFVYIDLYNTYIYIYIYIYIQCFPCLQNLARLKMALKILAHRPKSLDPGIYKKDASSITQNG